MSSSHKCCHPSDNRLSFIPQTASLVFHFHFPFSFSFLAPAAIAVAPLVCFFYPPGFAVSEEHDDKIRSFC
uniref:Transmembrane protein n=1 Tax=Caenorhabditis japonica TaxID=281687 RepID=A0A8R1E8Z1_CAEJA